MLCAPKRLGRNTFGSGDVHESIVSGGMGFLGDRANSPKLIGRIEEALVPAGNIVIDLNPEHAGFSGRMDNLICVVDSKTVTSDADVAHPVAIRLSGDNASQAKHYSQDPKHRRVEIRRVQNSKRATICSWRAETIGQTGDLSETRRCRTEIGPIKAGAIEGIEGLHPHLKFALSRMVNCFLRPMSTLAIPCEFRFRSTEVHYRAVDLPDRQKQDVSRTAKPVTAPFRSAAAAS